MRKAMVLGLLALAGTAASPSFAKDELSGFRVTAQIGSDTLENNIFFDGIGEENFNLERFGYGLAGGWSLNKWLAFEIGYNRGGEYNGEIFRDFVGPTEYVKAHVDQQSFEGTIVGSFWLNPRLGFFGRAGMNYWMQETAMTFGDTDPLAPPPARAYVDDNGVEPVYGLGIQTQLDGALVRLEYKIAHLGDVEVADTVGTIFSMTDQKQSTVSLSIVWTIH
jgi:hypothetical protein